MRASSCNAIDAPAAGMAASAPAILSNPLRLAERVGLTRAILALALRAPLRASKIAPAILSNPLRLAERVRFELTSPVRGCRFSRPVHSTALPPLHLLNNQSLTEMISYFQFVRCQEFYP